MTTLPNAELLEKLNVDLRNAQIVHVIVEMPVKHIGHGNFQFNNGVEARFSDIGVGYCYNHLKKLKIKYAYLTDLLRNEKFEEIAEILNKMEYPQYTASIFVGHIVGMTTKYNEIPHESIIESLKQADLINLMYAYNLTNKEMNLYISDEAIEVKEDGSFEIKSYSGMIVTNGHSGHTALSYRAYLRINSYEFQSQEISANKARHLSRVFNVYEQMEDTFKSVKDIALTERLRAIPTAKIFAKVIDMMDLSLRQERIVFDLDNEKNLENALDVVAYLSARLESNKKSGIEEILNSICDYAVNLGGYIRSDNGFVSFP